MKKVVSILLPVLFIFSGTECHQLLKLPVLIHHFIEHRNTDAGMSFMEFLNMHYNEQGQQQDQDDHHQLPFKNSCGGGMNHIVTGAVDQVIISLTHPASAMTKTDIGYHENFYSSSIQSSIWQPPKFS